MEPIKPKYKPYLMTDVNGKPRWTVVLQNGKHISQSRLVMMQFLHTDNLPKKFHVHHINRVTDDDRIENLLLLSNSDHIKLHNPIVVEGSYYSRNKSNPEYKERLKVYRKRNHAKSYPVNKENVEWMEHKYIVNRRFYDNHKDEPEFKERTKQYYKKHIEDHQDDPVWQEKIKINKRNSHLRAMSKPGAREKEAARVMEYRNKKKQEAANEISQLS